jgi:hypothetical protein
MSFLRGMASALFVAASLAPLTRPPPPLPAAEKSGLEWVASTDVSEKRESGNPWNVGTRVFGPRGLLVTMATPVDASQVKHVELSLDSNDDYRLAFLKGGVFVGGGIIWRRPYPGGLATYWADVPASVRETGFDGLYVLPFAGDGSYSLGHVRLLDF